MHRVFDINPYLSKLMVVIDSDPSRAVAKANIAHQGLHVDWAASDLGNAAITYERIYKAKGTRSTAQYIVMVLDADQVSPGIVGHEAVHVVNYVFKSKGQDLDIDNDEAQAYLTGWVIDTVYQVINEYNKQKRKK